jgi:hypothetical protein
VSSICSCARRRRSSISRLASLRNLRTLYLEDMKRIDLETLPPLPKLLGLQIGGGMWSTLKVASLAPLRRMPALRHLTLSNVKPADGSLRPLADLGDLRELQLPNFFEIQEFARLSVALPGAKSNASTPFFAAFDRTAEESSPFHCDKCGGGKHMMTGRPANMLCQKCDGDKIARRVAR